MEAQHDGDVTADVSSVKEAGSLEMLESELLNWLVGGGLRDWINSKLVNNSKEAFKVSIKWS